MAGRVLAVIPARLDSTRFPGKALYEFKDKPLLYYVWSRVTRARMIDRVVIATDSRKIAGHVSEFGAEAFLTTRRHATGSDRVAEVAESHRADIIINVQGDTFNLEPKVLDRVVTKMRKDRTVKFATIVRKIRSDSELFDPGVVKVITDSDNRALWFSRYPLPYLQHPTPGKRHTQHNFLGHIGVYFFRVKALRSFAQWGRSPLEKAESLEQLRIIENGGCIQVFMTRANTFSIDTPEDLKKVADCLR